MLICTSLQNVPNKKGEGPRHPPPIAGFSSFCNLITKDNITDITKKVNHKLSLFRLYSIWLFLCTIQIHCLIFLHRYICTCITLISSLSAYQSPPDTSHAYLKIAVAQICLHHKIRYCTIKSFFSILAKSSLFFQFIGINLWISIILHKIDHYLFMLIRSFPIII